MSASRDKTQKVAFVYSNLYQLYRKGKETAHPVEAAQVQPQAQPPTGQALAASAGAAVVRSGNVLKSDDLRAAALAITPYAPTEFIGKRVPRPEVIATKNSAVESLKKNLQELNDLHSRLRFMLKELEDLVKS
ncbi:MAG: hypothetical protein A2428_02245 [Bdellovibrionales bacterium RIFOXYC1_FULL_54_43]|nr:MAG: hypothetical protein A2428_02245 [Bdellovibrionales bacterium RIFOXYC1_FULL_54_43]OFZ84323.1 MAG: hypothetical protein A2603_07400 [Bdellovibrionales bacterium RIFOXYD1_FULL_55_31]